MTVHIVIREIKPYQVNIGADSKGHNLPEPKKDKVKQLVENIKDITLVHYKNNIFRILND